MERLLAFALFALWLNAGMASTVLAACTHTPDVPIARARWAHIGEKVGSAHNEDSCRASSGLFWEAVNIRQVVSICEEGNGRQRDLDRLDADIDALNEMIAVQCGR
jgi:hypothetical protein